MSDFHELRRTGIGGSDAAPALGISPWRTPYDLWLEKTGQSERITKPEPEWMLWGKLLEPVIASEYCRRTGRSLQASGGMLRHPKYTWMIANIDGRIDNEPGRIVEIKTDRGFGAHGWGEPGTDEIPLQYLTQVHHYLVVSGATIADVALLIGASDFRIYTVAADPVIASELIGREAAFWQGVEQNVPPDPHNISDAVARWGRLFNEGAVRADADALAAVEILRWAREERHKIEAEENEAKLVVMQALGERGDTLVDENGTRLVTWALDKGRRGFTVEPRDPSRRFLLK